MALEVEVRGLESLQKFLESSPQNIDSGVSESLDLLGEMTRWRAREYAPVRTGRLRESIELMRRGPFEVSLRSRVFYAGFQEFGTRFIAARLFITRALEEIRPLVLQVVKGRIEEWLRRRGE